MSVLLFTCIIVSHHRITHDTCAEKSTVHIEPCVHAVVLTFAEKVKRERVKTQQMATSVNFDSTCTLPQHPIICRFHAFVLIFCLSAANISLSLLQLLQPAACVFALME